ncbi:MAG: tRNA (adenosine(37)-N6)-threonylcarbamoyltransferase complex ATPase subunit type 1 TsaE [Rhodobacteraceae bacterium]|nr:tRNA (adenosine(37)-N6)-threonylcarbamoyltransferase complex ATPase subunit type 1 TsaE [Paracoccaceae bacterium]
MAEAPPALPPLRPPAAPARVATPAAAAAGNGRAVAAGGVAATGAEGTTPGPDAGAAAPVAAGGTAAGRAGRPAAEGREGRAVAAGEGGEATAAAARAADAVTLCLPDAGATQRLGAWLAPRLGPGDVLLLEGPLGSGKTDLARALIGARRAAAGLAPEDVPSPSFTLVQTYEDGAAGIWHADLYRLAGPAEVAELGLAEAFGAVLCLVEWPDRLGPLAPADALRLVLADRPAGEGEGRIAALAAPHPRHARLLAALAAAAAAIEGR